jgi:ABC-2 type transport system permease protein
VRGLLALHRTLLRISLGVMIQYRASGVIWMIGSILDPVIFLLVWSVAARSAGGHVGDMDPHDVAAYYIVLMLVSHLTFTWIPEVFQYRVQYGSLNFELLRPMHPIHADVADNVAYKLVNLAVAVPAVALCWIVFAPRIRPPAWSLAAAPLAVVLGFAVRFTLDWSVALVAFWTTRIMAVNRTYYGISAFTSGRVAPIALLPGPLGALARALPFYYALGFPVDLVLGRLSPAQAAHGFVVQAVWLLLGVALVGTVWRSAVRRFTAVGG